MNVLLDLLAFGMGVLVAAWLTWHIVPDLQRVTRRSVSSVRDSVSQFFFGSELDVRVYRDPLVDIIAENPHVSLSFITHVMALAAVCAVATALPCILYLKRNWSSCGECDRPLRAWVLANAVIAASQLPFRLIFVIRLQYLKSLPVATMTAGFHLLTSSRAWCLMKAASFVNYGWFFLGVYWTFTSAECPALGRMCLGLTTLALVRVFITIGCFYYYFPTPNGGRGRRSGVLRLQNFRHSGLTVSKLHLLPQPVIVQDALALKEELCSICISDFKVEDSVRSLPQCSHIFHTQCIDQWLLTSGTCPLCQRAVEPCGSGERSRCIAR